MIKILVTILEFCVLWSVFLKRFVLLFGLVWFSWEKNPISSFSSSIIWCLFRSGETTCDAKNADKIRTRLLQNTIWLTHLWWEKRKWKIKVIMQPIGLMHEYTCNTLNAVFELFQIERWKCYFCVSVHG